jgi:hypothetical protein
VYWCAIKKTFKHNEDKMMIDKQGKNSGETAPNKSNQRPSEHDADAISKARNQTKDKVNKTLND